MKKVFAVAARELVDRRMIFITAAVLAVLPFAAMLIPEAARHGRERVIGTTAAATSLVYGFALVFLLGGSFVVRELTDKRMSFYFSKPLTGPAIWFGKLTGTIATIVASLAIILIPSIAATGNLLLQKDEAILWFGAAMFAWLLIAHVGATMVRSRSPLLLLDAAAVAFSGWVVYRIVCAFEAGYARHLIAMLFAALTVVVLLILIAAGAWQVSRGRIDAQANHRELSRFLWSAMAVTLIAAGAWAWWVVSVDPADLSRNSVHLDESRSGNWIRLGGETKHRRDYHAIFFINVANGSHVRADGRTLWRDGFFTPDGRIAGQLRAQEGSRDFDLDLVKFDDRGAQVVPTSIAIDGSASLMPSDDGRQLAVLSGDTLTVRSLPEGKVRMSARLPLRPRNARYFFVTPDLVRLYADALDQTQIFQLDLRAKKLSQSGAIQCRAFFNTNADASRLFVRNIDTADSYIADARTGARIAVANGRHGAILSDGRVAAVPVGDGEKAVSIGAMSVAVPDIHRVQIFRELRGNRLLVGGPVNRKETGWTLHVIDLNTGKVIRTARNLTPLQTDFFSFHGRDPRHTISDAPLIVKENDAVVSWVPATGAKRTLISSL